ncbi:23S rRNA (adenine(2503)-C(2))-methyltransferase RlmN [bacterium]|nr:23S rRNA (adenine(2503)-C(2))-methyltransferase RlmN [bacterium]
MNGPAKKTHIKALGRAGLEQWVSTLGEKPYRARQLWKWLIQRGAVSFSDMTDLSKAFRARLEATAEIKSLRQVSADGSRDTGAVKFLWECPDGNRIESVHIPEGDRRTVCISSQVGCGLGCLFCATGRLGFTRNLESWEILDQVIGVRRETGAAPTNIVVMGMGEPFLNYDAVMDALAVMNDPEGLAIGHRKITVSTAGVIPGLLRFTEENRPYKLAVSLNAATDGLRTRIMPVNRKYPIAALMEAVRAYSRAPGRRVTFEYVLLAGLNDSREDASRLLALLRGLPCKVNLIPYNPAVGGFQRPDEDRVERFLEWIKPLRSPVIVRWSRGADIGAACGQLAGSRPDRQDSPAFEGPTGGLR